MRDVVKLKSGDRLKRRCRGLAPSLPRKINDLTTRHFSTTWQHLALHSSSPQPLLPSIPQSNASGGERDPDLSAGCEAQPQFAYPSRKREAPRSTYTTSTEHSILTEAVAISSNPSLSIAVKTQQKWEYSKHPN